MAAQTHAVVLGGGMAGMLAASVLAHTSRVTIVERDSLPDGPAARKGVPQARHAHLLMSGGVRVIESLLPGTQDRWLAAGARRITLPSELVSMAPTGWLRRWPQMQFLITCSRDLLDWVVRDQVLRHPGIVVRQNTDVAGLLGDAKRVAGVQIRDDTGVAFELDADLVIDATGRGSRAPRWLTQLGLPPVREAVVDAGLAYATRVFKAPDWAGNDFPIVNVQADARTRRPGRGAVLLPIEERRWLVTIAGTRGGEPTTNEEDFVPFARSIRHPVIGDLIAAAQPLTPVYGSRSTANRRRYFERLGRWPDGFLVLGDAAATFNPVYGHGISVAAQQVAVLRNALADDGVRTGTARQVQRDICRSVEGAWVMATLQDRFFPDAIGPRPSIATRAIQRYVNRLTRTANTRPHVAHALLDAFTLSTPMTALGRPRVALATLRGPGQPPLPEPPFNDHERSMIMTLDGPHTAPGSG